MWQNIHKLGLCGYFRDLAVTIKLQPQTLHFPQTKITYVKVISSIFRDLSDLPFRSYGTKYVKNVQKNV